MTSMLDSDWLLKKMLRSDWLGPIGASLTTLVFEKKGNRSTRWRTSRSEEENSLPFSPDLVKKVLACAIRNNHLY